MVVVQPLAPDVSIAGALDAGSFSALAAQGFRAVINFRPDGESIQQLSSAEARQAAQNAGLAYHHIPAAKHELFTDDIVSAAQRAFASVEGPVVAHCASGQRAAIVWAASRARTVPVNDVLDSLSRAGFDLAFLRDDLDAQADRARWQPRDDGQSERGGPAGMRDAEMAAA